MTQTLNHECFVSVGSRGGTTDVQPAYFSTLVRTATLLSNGSFERGNAVLGR